MKTFPNLSTPLVKLDLTFEAGSRYQPQTCVAHAANQLMGWATQRHTADEIAEFVDFRGIVIERSADSCSSCLSVYFLHRYADELLPLLHDMVEMPLLPTDLFAAHLNKRRQQLQTNAQKTSVVARNVFYEELFGPTHPLGVYARPEEVDRLTPQLVTDFWHDRYQSSPGENRPKYWITLSGHVDDDLVAKVNTYLPEDPHGLVCPPLPNNSTPYTLHPSPNTQHPTRITVPSATQTSLRVGRILPLAWDDPDYFRFLMLNTVLGGYFGSRLMGNLREKRGYTYGIYSQTRIFRGCIVLYITADVATQAADDALLQIDAEMERLSDSLVSAEELYRVRNFMWGDYLRSIDGIFERSERWRQMRTTGVDDRFETLFNDALLNTTPEQLQQLAQRFLVPSQMLHLRVGNTK